MATVTTLFSIYFFIASFVGLFRFLRWKGGEKTDGYATSVSGPVKVNNYFTGAKQRYTYEMVARDEGYAFPCKYVETTERDAAPGLELNTMTDLILLKSNSKCIRIQDYQEMKKKLYMNPLCCIGCIALTVVLIMIASSL